MNKRLFLIFHGRFPSEKAAALFAAESAKSFAVHLPTTILVPRRLGRGRNPHSVYALPSAVSVIYLPTIDLFFIPFFAPVAFFISYLAFTIACFIYLATNAKRDDVIDTNEPLPAYVATFFSHRVIIEVHDFPEHFHGFFRTLFSRVHTVLATNEWKKEALKKTFDIPEEKLLMVRNGVDVAQFSPKDKWQSRVSLNVNREGAIVVYTGHLYSWKGADVLAKAAKELPDVEVYFIGGTKSDVANFTQEYGDAANIHFLGHRPHREVPLWQGAADVLVLPNSAKEEISLNYTSPMKLFEYMASGRPIIASDIPSIREILPSDAGVFVPPDEPKALARAITEILQNKQRAGSCAQRASEEVRQYAWDERARIILSAVMKA